MDELTSDDRQHLELLGICHYVKAGLWALGCLAGGLYVGMGAFIGRAVERNGPPPGGGPSGDQIAMVAGAVGVFIVLLSLAGAGMSIFAARCLRDRRHRTFLIVLSAIHLLSFPFGTALGVFTLIVLLRPSVTAAFERR